MARSPDPSLRAEKPTGLGGTHPIEAEMHAIDLVLGWCLRPGPQSERHIGAPIHDDAHAVGTGRLADRGSASRRSRDALRKLQKGSTREILLAYLHPVHAIRNDLGNHVLERTAGKGAVRDEAKNGPGGRRQD